MQNRSTSDKLPSQSEICFCNVWVYLIIVLLVTLGTPTSTCEVQNRSTSDQLASESEICFLNVSICQILFLTELVTSETPASNCEEQNRSTSDQLPSQGENWFLTFEYLLIEQIIVIPNYKEHLPQLMKCKTEVLLTSWLLKVRYIFFKCIGYICL